MTVYVDAVFGLNGLLNYLMLLSSARLAGAPFRHRRLWLAAALGGLYAAAACWPPCLFLRSGWMKAVMLAVMALTAFGAARRTVRLALLFAAVSAALAGAATVLVQLLHLGALILPGGVFYPVSARALLGLAAGCCLLCHLVFNCALRHTGGQIVPLTVSLGTRSVTLPALVDTGNTLRDPMTNEPVLVTSWQTAARLLPEAGLRQAEFQNPAQSLPGLAQRFPALRFRLLHYRAIGTECGLLLAFRCRVTDEAGRGGPRLVAFSPASVSPDGQFEALTGGCI